MRVRPWLLPLAVTFVSLSTGCAPAEEAEETDGDAVIEDEVRTDRLRALTVVRGAVGADETVEVAYEPASPAYAGASAVGKLPFLAVEVEGDVPPDAKVTVSGDFPGSPRVLVVDESFRVMAATSARPLEGADVATLTATKSTGKKLVLVRDALWTKPMTFQVQVTR